MGGRVWGEGGRGRRITGGRGTTEDWYVKYDYFFLKKERQKRGGSKCCELRVHETDRLGCEAAEGSPSLIVVFYQLSDNFRKPNKNFPLLLLFFSLSLCKISSFHYLFNT